jgi:membrane fusion protein, multidrug efflux system
MAGRRVSWNLPNSMEGRAVRILKIGIGLGLVIAAIALAFPIFEREFRSNSGAGAAQSPAAMAMPVPVTAVVKKTIPIYLEYSARTESIRDISLQAKISGYVQQQHVPDGSDVKRGELLYTIDPRDFQAALDQSKAQAQRDSAALDYARVNLKRGADLTKDGYLPADSFDQRTSTLRQAEAALSFDHIAIRIAEINLGYTEIRAPFAGRLGRNQAPAGTLVSASGGALNTLVQLDPIYVTFNASETDLPAIQEARTQGKVDAGILLPGTTTPRHKGELTFLNNTIDRATGTIIGRATIGNSDFGLLPGQYVRVRLHIKDEADALLVPQTALGSSQLGKYVYLAVNGKAEQRLVTLGAADGNMVAVEKGLSEGDLVITGNLQKIGPGVPVQTLPKG